MKSLLLSSSVTSLSKRYLLVPVKTVESNDSELIYISSCCLKRLYPEGSLDRMRPSEELRLTEVGNIEEVLDKILDLESGLKMHV